MQIFLLIFIRGLRGPRGNGLVGHCTISGHSLNPPLLRSTENMRYVPQRETASDDTERQCADTTDTVLPVLVARAGHFRC